jgi:hypothetical protein
MCCLLGVCQVQQTSVNFYAVNKAVHAPTFVRTVISGWAQVFCQNHIWHCHRLCCSLLLLLQLQHESTMTHE